MYYPTLKLIPQTSKSVDVFKGYNHSLKIRDGELYDMKNLTGEHYPLLSSRRKRGTVAQLTAPAGLLAKSKLVYLDGSRLFYGGQELTGSLSAAGLSISTNSAMLPKKLVSMGAYICIFPDKLYINAEDPDDCGSMEASFTAAGTVSYSLCRADGSAYAAPTLSATEPQNPANGALWLDSSDAVHVLKQYSSDSSSWSAAAEVYVKISCTGIGADFQSYDGVSISGCAAPSGSGEAVSAQIEELNGTKIISARGDDYIVVTGILDGNVSQSGGVEVSRTLPDMDFVTEAENRLWGCKYGAVNGKTVNEIYACALGDFKNWSQFMGLSTDSYAASVGTDGPFTGAVTHLGYPVFFKENCLHKVYISPLGAHRIADTACRGVQSGCHESLCVVNETLFYKSRGEICAYDGSLPVSVSSALGGERYGEAAAGAMGDRYYISMKDGSGAWHLFVLDTARGFWHREDAVHALCFARADDELYYIDADTHCLMAELGSTGSAEAEVDWEAVTGLFGTELAEHKYVGRVNLRMKLPVGSSADMYIQYDSEPDWCFAGHMEGVGTGSFLLPVRPRRCDHFRIKLKGKGEMKLYSLTKIMERGSDR